MGKYTVEFRGSYRFLSGIKGSGVWALVKSSGRVLSNEETQFLKKNIKNNPNCNVRNFRSGAIFQWGPFSVNPCQLCKIRMNFLVLHMYVLLRARSTI